MSQGVSKIGQVAIGAVIGFMQGGPWGAVIGAGLALYSANQQAKLATDTTTDSEPSATTVRSSKAAVRFILGRVSTGGLLAWAQEQGGDQTDSEWLHLVYVLGEGAIAGIDQILLGEEDIGTFGEYVDHEVVIDPTGVNAFLKANCPDWKDSQIGRGLSYVRLSLRYSAEKFPSGIPDVRFIVRGRNDVYDPRSGNSGYSQNTALHLLWFLRNRCNVPDDEINFASFADAANTCEESVSNADGTAGVRYQTGAVIGADEQRTQVLQKLEQACGGQLIRVGGTWMLQVGAYYGPYDFTVTEDMVIGTVTGATEVSNDSAINIIRGTFVDPSQSWADTDYPEVRVDEWVAADGGEASETLSFSYVTDPYQAQRLANMELRRRRAGGSLSIPLNFNGYNCRPGRVVRVYLPTLNIDGEFIVQDWTMTATGGCTVNVAQYDAGMFGDAVGQPYSPIGFISLPTGGIGSPTNLAWTPTDGSEVSQGVLSWVAPTVGSVVGYVVTIRQGTKAIQSVSLPETATQTALNNLPSGNYTMSVAAVGPLARSGEVSITVSIGGPPIPESVTVQASLDSITLIPRNTAQGLNGGTYEYWFTTDSKATADKASYLGQGLTFTHTGLAFYTNYFYFVRSRNAYGVSEFLKVNAATSNDVSAYLAGLNGKITETQLGQQLLSKVDLITAPSTTPGSVAAQVAQEAKARADADTAEATARVNADKVNADAITTEANARAAAVLQEAKDRQAAVTSEATTRQSADTSLGQRIDTVSAANGSNATAIQTEVKARTDADTALGSRIDTVAAISNGNTTAISNEVKARTDADSALGTRIDSLSTTVGNNTTAITSETKARTDADTALGQRVDTVSTTVAGKADSSTVQTLQNQVTAQGTTITSQGSAITSINANLTNAGGENLLYNPAFTEVSSNAALAKGWNLDGGTVDSTTSATASLVTSWLSSAEKSMRIDFIGVDLGGRYFSIVTASAYRAKATAGQVLTASIYVRATAGIRMEIYIQALKADGTAIGAPASGLFVLDTAGKRISFTHPGLPTDTALVAVFYRVRPSTAGVADGYVEGTRAQLEVGAIATGWKNNGQVAADATTANATALTAVTARVTSAEGTITNQGAAITSLQNGLSTTNGNVTAAQNSISALQNTVTSQGNSITAQGNQITTINSNLATAGGENLLLNPGFDTTDPADATLPQYWTVALASGVSATRTLPASTLDPSGKMLSLALSGLGLNNSAAYADVVVGLNSNLPRVINGQSVTLSVYFYCPAELSCRLYAQVYDSSFANIAGQGGSTAAVVGTGTWQRLSLTVSVTAANAFAFKVYLRTFASTSSTSSGTISFDRAQVEIGATVTGWRDNTKVLGVATAANSTATSALGTRVTAAEGNITSQGSQITNLQAQVAGAGNFVAAQNWEFLGSVRSWYLEQAASGATLTANTAYATISGYANFRIASFTGIEGTANPIVRIRFRRKNTTRGAGARLYWANQDGALSEARTASWTVDLSTTDWQTVEIDLSANAGWVGKTNTSLRIDLANSADTSALIDIAWVAIGRKAPAASAQALSDTQATVTQQGTTLTSQGSAITSLTSRVASTETTTAAQANAISALDTKATNQGNQLSALATQTTGIQALITPQGSGDGGWGAGDATVYAGTITVQSAAADATQAQAQRIDTVQANLGSNIAAVQTTQTALATLDGRVSAAYSIKTEVTVNGQRYAAGLALGVDASGGTITSQFLVMASRFAVLSTDGGVVTSPFVIQNGQTIINVAIIGDGTITNAKIGDTIQSTAVGTNGAPVWSLSKTSGLAMNSAGGGGRMQVTGEAIKIWDGNGVLRVQLGNLSA